MHQILIARTFYENLLLSGMLLSDPRPTAPTLRSISQLVIHDDWSLMFPFPTGGVERYMRSNGTEFGSRVDEALNEADSEQVAYATDVNLTDWFAAHPRTFAFHYSNSMRRVLQQIPDAQCHQFQIAELRDYPATWMALLLNPQMPRKQLEQLNAEITARAEWVRLEQQRTGPASISQACWDHYFPVAPAGNKLDIEYMPLKLQAIADWIVVYLILVATASAAFAGEWLMRKIRGQEEKSKESKLVTKTIVIDMTILRQIPTVDSIASRDVVVEILAELTNQLKQTDPTSDQVLIRQ